jgi:hypothetical protein
MRLPINLLIASGTILASVTLSLVATAHPWAPTKAQHTTLTNTHSTSQAAPASHTQTPTTTSASTPVVAGAATTKANTPAHTNTSPPTPSPSQPPSQPSNPKPPVTVVSATLSDWQDGDTILLQGGTTYYQQRRNCMYTYSDSSTKQTPYDGRYYDKANNVIKPGSQTTPTYSCDISTAPSAS